MNLSVNSLENGASQDLVWSVKPAKESPKKVAVIFVIALAAGVMGLFFTRSILLAMLGFVTILGVTMDFWLGTNYRLGEEAAHSGWGPKASEMKWEDVRRVVISERTILLSPFSASTKLDNYRGLRLDLRGVDANIVGQVVRARCKENVRFLAE
jgi:hypothetical protein